MPTWQPNLAPLLGRIPRLYSLLKALGEGIHAQVGVTPSMRSILAALSFGEPRAAPDLARERAVSRQHVQSVINELLSAGLIQRLIITRVPVLIGDGIPLFGSLPHDIRLRHIMTKHYPSGLVSSEYAVEA